MFGAGTFKDGMGDVLHQFGDGFLEAIVEDRAEKFAEDGIAFPKAGAGGWLIEPLLITALPPFGEVLGIEGASAEFLGQDGPDFGEGIEPLHEADGGFAAMEACVELFTDRFREFGNLTISRFHVG